MRGQAIRCLWRVLLMLAAVLGTFGRALAAGDKAGKLGSAAADQAKAEAPPNEKPSDVPSLEPDSSRAKSAKTSKRDPTASAFAVPHGTELNAKQKEALKKLRSDMEPKLRSALEKVQKATKGADKNSAAAEVQQIRKEIRDGIDKIIDMAADDAAKQQADAMRQAQQAEAMRRAQQNQRYRSPYPSRYR